MSMQKIVKTGSTIALAVVTLVSPLATLKAWANPMANQAIELSQSPKPSPAPTPESTPEPTPEPESTPEPTPAPAAPTPPAAAPETTPAPRADVSGLFERVEYINACRQTNRSVEVFADTALSSVNRIGTLEPSAQISLTGVLAPGRAQIVRRESPDSAILLVGWVNSAYLTSCGSPPPTGKVCYEVNVPTLTLRSAPSSTSSYQGTISAGSIVYATSSPPTERTSPNSPPDFGRIWVQVYVRNNLVWISRTGPNGAGNNATQLSEAACNQ